MVRTLRKLSTDEITKFSTRYHVKQIAVENFLSTVHNNPDNEAAFANLYEDANLYDWCRETMTAIADGIRKATYTAITIVGDNTVYVNGEEIGFKTDTSAESMVNHILADMSWVITKTAKILKAGWHKEWCTCGGELANNDWVFVDCDVCSADETCECNIQQSHYHCKECFGVARVG